MTDAELMDSPAFKAAMASRSIMIGCAELRELSHRNPELIKDDVPDLELALSILGRILFEQGKRRV